MIPARRRGLSRPASAVSVVAAFALVVTVGAGAAHAGKGPTALRRAPAKAKPKKKTAPPKITEFSLRRTMCLGSCPAYTVTLRHDGRASFVGRAHAPRSGRYIGRIYAWSYKRLAKLIEAARFAALKRSYRRPVTCQSSAIVSVKYSSGGSHTVVDYGAYGPAKLWGLQLAIDAVASKIAWRRPPAKGAAKPPSAKVYAGRVAARVNAARKRLKLPALKRHSWLDSWARAMVEARVGKRGGTHGLTRQLDPGLGVVAQHIACRSKRASDVRVDYGKGSPLRRRAVNRFGVAAVYDKNERRFCVVVLLGRRR